MIVCSRCYNRNWWFSVRCRVCGVLLSRNKLPEIPTEQEREYRETSKYMERLRGV